MSGPTADELRDLRGIAVLAAGIARDVIMPLYEKGTGVDFKADGTPVTAADRNAEEAIRALVERECPSHGILGEEFGEKPGEGPYRWVIDPIDGTKSFIHHVPLFGTLIAVEHSGSPVVGVIACHAAGEVAVGVRGLGATLNDAPISVSKTSDMAEATVLTTSVQGMANHHSRSFESLNGRAKLVRTWGDCFGYLAVAAGRAEVMIDPVMNYWDVAALYPIITEAGGRITTIDGSEGPGDSVVATNGPLHDEVIAAMALDR